MVQLSPEIVSALQRRSERPEYRIEENPRQAFISHLQALGFVPPMAITPKKRFRMFGPGDKSRTAKNKWTGWGIYYENGTDRLFATGVFGSWRGVETQKWLSHSTNAMTPQEWEYHTEDIRLAEIEAERERNEAYEEAAKRAFEIWYAAGIAVEHEYLARKGVKALEGVRIDKGNLVVPIYNAAGMTSLQFIKPNGEKKNLPAGKKKGCWYCIKGAGDITYVVEGYATGASIHMATGATVYVAFDCGNLYEVAAYVKTLGGTVIIAGDDDTETENNPGRTKATQAATGLGLECIFPPEGYVDFNDYHASTGLDELAAHVFQRPRVYKRKGAEEQEASPCYLSAPGILGHLFNYYNATAGIPQPGFALQTALAICSVVCGRNFTTNYKHYSALYLMILGKSGAGKEHSNEIIQGVLSAAGQMHLLGGSGYTSGGAVISTSQAKPRHLSIIDEFSKYMQSAQSKNSNGNYQGANKKLMEAITSCATSLRGENYSAMGLSKERKKDVEIPYILKPSITIMAMATPDDMFKTMSIESIKDGFYNRFIFNISDSPRIVREYKEPLAVPENIVEWIKAISERRGYMPELPTDQPLMQQLTIKAEAMVLIQEMEQYRVDRANELERFHLAEITQRIAEFACRIGMICALAEDPHANVVKAHHIQWGIDWVKYNHIRLTNRLKAKISSSEFESRKLECLEAFRAAGDMGVTERELVVAKPFSKYDKKQLNEVLDSLKSATLIDFRKRITGKAGKPAMAYVAIDGE